MKRALCWVLLIVVLIIPSPGWAKPIMGEFPEVLPPDHYFIQTKIIYTVMKRWWDEDGQKMDYLPHEHPETKEGFKALEVEMPLKIYYGAAEHLELGLILPFLWLRERADRKAMEKSGSDVGDMEISLKYNFLEFTPVTPAITGLLVVKIPTGEQGKREKKESSSLPTGSGSTDITFMGILAKELHPFVAYLNLGYKITGKGKTHKGEEINTGNVLFYDIALDLAVNKRATLVGELKGQFSGKDNLEGNRYSLITASAGIQYGSVKAGGLIFEAGVLTRLTGKNAATGWAPISGISYEF